MEQEAMATQRWTAEQARAAATAARAARFARASAAYQKWIRTLGRCPNASEYRAMVNYLRNLYGAF